MIRYLLPVLLLTAGCKKNTTTSGPTTSQAPADGADDAGLQEFVTECALGCGGTEACTGFCTCVADNWLRGQSTEAGVAVLFKMQSDPDFLAEVNGVCAPER